jgi:hypothetical protein
MGRVDPGDRSPRHPTDPHVSVNAPDSSTYELALRNTALSARPSIWGELCKMRGMNAQDRAREKSVW